MGCPHWVGPSRGQPIGVAASSFLQAREWGGGVVRIGVSRDMIQLALDNMIVRSSLLAPHHSLPEPYSVLKLVQPLCTLLLVAMPVVLALVFFPTASLFFLNFSQSSPEFAMAPKLTLSCLNKRIETSSKPF